MSVKNAVKAGAARLKEEFAEAINAPDMELRARQQRNEALMADGKAPKLTPLPDAKPSAK